MRVGWLAAALCAAVLWPGGAVASPHVPGVARLLAPHPDAPPMVAVPARQAAAQTLLTELRCGACHAWTGRRESVRPAPPLAGLGDRTLPTYVRAFVSAPQTVRPGTSMPDVLAQLPAGDRDAAAEDLTHYLFSLSAPALGEAQWGDLQARDEGRALFASLGCVACHGPPDAAVDENEAFVSLAHLPRKTNAAALKRFLADPQAVRPHTRMPNFRLSDSEQQALTMYLLRDQLPATIKGTRSLHRAGVRYEYFEGFVREGPPEWQEMKFVRRGEVPRFELPPNIRNTKLALRQSALVDVPRDGTYSFFTESNDGSELWVDRQLVVTNHGFHGPLEAAGTVKLTAGLHQVDVIFWQDEGGKSLKVLWQGPGIKKSEIPAAALLLPGSVAMKLKGDATLAVDAQKAAHGRQLFAQLGCGNCHEGVEGKQRVADPKALLIGPKNAAAGCLSPAVAGGAPDYHLTQAQRVLLAEALKTKPAPKPNVQALAELAAHNCLACHERDGFGGVTEDLSPHFGQTIEVDLGDEGRLPPSLTAAGEKLRPEAIRRIVGRAELHVRPYMSARMPTFPLADADWFAKLLPLADGGRPQVPGKMPIKTLEEGRRLLGVSSDMARTGFGCINCHNVAMRPAVGSPGPDLELAPVRLNFAWFDKWLAQPQAIRPSTRMPAFWGEQTLFPNVAGGSAKKQRAAIWGYLAAGATPLPEGLALSKQKAELRVGSEPIVYRTFMKDVGPRAIVVGNPEMVHLAFDANTVRMAKAWRGRFWDPSGTWTGRSGEFNEPLGDHVMDLPPGPAFALLPNAAAAWPAITRDARNVGGQFLGYHLDAQRRPVFRYDLQGTEIAETGRPRRTAEGFALVRSFTIKSPQPQLYFLAAAGSRISKRGDDKFVVEDRVEVRVPPVLQKHASVRSGAEGQQLLVRLPENVSTFDVEVRW